MVMVVFLNKIIFCDIRKNVIIGSKFRGVVCVRVRYIEF